MNRGPNLRIGIGRDGGRSTFKVAENGLRKQQAVQKLIFRTVGHCEVVMYNLSEFQKDLQRQLLTLLKSDFKIKVIDFKDKSAGLNITYRSFEFWIYDDEAMFKKYNQNYIFESPDFNNDEELKFAFLSKISELL